MPQLIETTQEQVGRLILSIAFYSGSPTITITHNGNELGNLNGGGIFTHWFENLSAGEHIFEYTVSPTTPIKRAEFKLLTKDHKVLSFTPPANGINAVTLEAELKAASPNYALVKNGAAIQCPPDTLQSTIQGIIDLHDGTVLSEDQKQEAIRDGAKTIAANIPNYATWSESEAESWINANVTDLASAKQVLVGLMKMTFALRNKQWPDLQGS